MWWRSAVLALALASCTAGESISGLHEGMTLAQVEQVMGKPDGFARSGGYTAYRYSNRLMSGWGWDRADYAVIFDDGRVVQYGPGTIRPREGPSTGLVVVAPAY